MKIQTRDFGEIEVQEKDLYTFVSPIYGFENYKKFMFIKEAEISDKFVWLQSVEEQDLCFILTEQGEFATDYSPKISQDIVKLLGEGEYMCLVMVSLRNPLDKSTANLKSPIIINTKNNSAAQVVLEQDYPIRYPLFRKED